jgi:hypothetical protein
MKLLVLIIAVILISVFAEPIYAQEQVIESKQINVSGTIDQELIDFRRLAEETNEANGNADEKDGLLDEINQAASELVPKQIAILLKKQKLRAFYEARDKYMLCLQNKNRDCSTLKSKYESEMPSKNAVNSNSNNDHTTSYTIINPSILKKIRQCSQITQDSFPDFRAAVQMDFTIDEQGKATSAYIDEDRTEMTHELTMFNKCIEYFALKLNFKNDSGRPVSFKKNFIFG